MSVSVVDSIPPSSSSIASSLLRKMRGRWKPTNTSSNSQIVGVTVTKRLHRLYRRYDTCAPIAFAECKLTDPEVLLRWTLNDFDVLFDSYKVVWTTPDCFVSCLGDRDSSEPNLQAAFSRFMHFTVVAEEDDKWFGYCIEARNHQHGSSTLALISQLLARYDKLTSVDMHAFCPTISFPLTCTTLKALVGQSKSPQKIHFEDFRFDETQCRTLAKASDSVHLCFRSSGHRCVFADKGAALVDCIRANQGPKGLSFYNCFDSDMFPNFANALCTNSRLQILDFVFNEGNFPDLDGFAAALEENQGLTQVSLTWVNVKDETFTLLMKSLRYHPALRKLSLTCRNWLSDEKRTSRVQEIKQMLETNTVLSNFNCRCRLVGNQSFVPAYDVALFKKAVRPRLEINRFRKYVAAISSERDTEVRRKQLAWAVSAVSDKPNIIYQLVSGNSDIIELP